jgi:uncharacterized protein (DUF2147 family)
LWVIISNVFSIQKKMRIFSLLLLLLALGRVVSAQGINGTWKSVDDETGEAKSHIEIYDSGSGTYGKIAKVLRANAPENCEKCPGERKNKPLLGMVVLVNMQRKDGMLQGGDILDPEKGKWYKCKMWLKEGDPNTLVVRGYLGPFYRTQYWSRVR